MDGSGCWEVGSGVWALGVRLFLANSQGKASGCRANKKVFSIDFLLFFFLPARIPFIPRGAGGLEKLVEINWICRQELFERQQAGSGR